MKLSLSFFLALVVVSLWTEVQGLECHHCNWVSNITECLKSPPKLCTMNQDVCISQVNYTLNDEVIYKLSCGERRACSTAEEKRICPHNCTTCCNGNLCNNKEPTTCSCKTELCPPFSPLSRNSPNISCSSGEVGNCNTTASYSELLESNDFYVSLCFEATLLACQKVISDKEGKSPQNAFILTCDVVELVESFSCTESRPMKTQDGLTVACNVDDRIGEIDGASLSCDRKTLLCFIIYQSQATRSNFFTEQFKSTPKNLFNSSSTSLVTPSLGNIHSNMQRPRDMTSHVHPMRHIINHRGMTPMVLGLIVGVGIFATIFFAMVDIMCWRQFRKMRKERKIEPEDLPRTNKEKLVTVSSPPAKTQV